MHACEDGHMCHYYQVALFEPLHWCISKTNTWIFLASIKEHMQVNTFVFTKLAELFSNEFGKDAKWQCNNINKILTFLTCNQTNPS